MFFNDDQLFDLATSQLRHITLEEIQCNRCVDYEHGWTDNTAPGIVITYDRYGEQNIVQYTAISHDSFNDFLATGEGQFLHDDRTDHISLSSSETEDEDITLISPNGSRNEPTKTVQLTLDQTEAFRRLLPMLLDEMNNSQLLEIWPDLDVNAIEELRRQSFPSEASTSKDNLSPVINEHPLL
jgi:hypothetical protein